MPAEYSSRNALPPGAVLNGVYIVEAELGHGGIGIVYRARHKELGPVAIKEYLPTELVVREEQSVHPVSTEMHGMFKDGLDRFLVEAQQLIRFRMHPNIVSCRDFFRANGTAYLVMDLEEGMTLSELLFAREAEERPFSETDLLTVTIPLLEGLGHVHEAGVLHRDIKPANIFIRRKDNSPVLIDFGAAKQEFAQHSKSLAPFSHGYAAIEQVAEGTLGTWTDIYGVGAVMWRMVAGGNKPFDPPNPVRAEQRAYALFQGKADPMPSAQLLGKDKFSPRILAAIDQCLALQGENRLQGCQDLLARLEGSPKSGKPAAVVAEKAATKKPPDAHRKPAPRRALPKTHWRAREHAAKRKSLLTGLAVTVSLIVFLGVFFAWRAYNKQEEIKREVLVNAARRAEARAEEAEARAAEAEFAEAEARAAEAESAETKARAEAAFAEAWGLYGYETEGIGERLRYRSGQHGGVLGQYLNQAFDAQASAAEARVFASALRQGNSDAREMVSSMGLASVFREKASDARQSASSAEELPSALRSGSGAQQYASLSWDEAWKKMEDDAEHSAWIAASEAWEEVAAAEEDLVSTWEDVVNTWEDVANTWGDEANTREDTWETVYAAAAWDAEAAAWDAEAEALDMAMDYLGLTGGAWGAVARAWEAREANTE